METLSRFGLCATNPLYLLVPRWLTGDWRLGWSAPPFILGADRQRGHLGTFAAILQSALIRHVEFLEIWVEACPVKELSIARNI